MKVAAFDPDCIRRVRNIPAGEAPRELRRPFCFVARIGAGKLRAIRRAGADIVLTYWAQEWAERYHRGTSR